MQYKKRIWKKIASLKNWYSASSDGLIRREKPACGTRKGRIKKPVISNVGYYMVSIYVNKKHYHKTVHKLVAKTFLGECPKGYEINHKDSNKLNNCINNLEYITSKENTQHAIKNNHFINGSKCGTSKLNENKVKQIRDLYNLTTMNQYELAEYFNVTQPNIQAIVTRRSWKHI